jgi:hypothetical protein
VVQDVAPSLQCVAVIDAVHLQEDDCHASYGTEVYAEAISLQWLGTSEFVLAVLHGSVAYLLSLRAALQNPYQGHSQHSIVARIVAPSDILSLAVDPNSSSVFLTTAGRTLACHSVSKHTQAPPGGTLPLSTLSWSQETPGEHSLLCITPHTRHERAVMLASASTSKPSVSVWRLSPNNKDAASHERVPVPVPSAAVQFRPHTCTEFTPKELCPPETLIAVGQDGSIRLWVDNDAAATMPAALLEAAANDNTTVDSTMCLAQILTPPSLKPMRAPKTIAQWAESPADLPDSLTTSWLVATVYDSAPGQSGSRGALEEVESSDEVFVWGVTVLPLNSTEEGSTNSSVLAACSSPRVTANLWAFDAYKVPAPDPYSNLSDRNV